MDIAHVGLSQQWEPLLWQEHYMGSSQNWGPVFGRAKSEVSY